MYETSNFLKFFYVFRRDNMDISGSLWAVVSLVRQFQGIFRLFLLVVAGIENLKVDSDRVDFRNTRYMYKLTKIYNSKWVKLGGTDER